MTDKVSIARPARPSRDDPAVEPAGGDAAADQRDVRAEDRDERAEARDVAALRRDTDQRAATGDRDPGFAARFLAAGNRDDAAGDRADARDDRLAARRDRERAARDGQRGDPPAGAVECGEDLQRTLESRTLVGQAQRLLMAEDGLSFDEAFEVLRRASQAQRISVREVAEEMIQGVGRRLP